ncbi:unnamed protein product [Cyprideis torosa]|uniref:Uncharacterized protein n=1 Tax=Cyprideis torosa TaxID=163714 RepID=A0A7R8W0Z8_9CRUS|nr:unnamed protein product [Cyprideis torosa]CAG0880317.1 unnamed protein product [Cyprideis torosa]
MGLKSFFSTFWYWVQVYYCEYEMATALYMMDTKEKVVINTIFLIILGMSAYSTYVFFPHYVWNLLTYTGIISDGGVNVFSQNTSPLSSQEL